jgi:putative ABC transport system permease protein
MKLFFKNGLKQLLKSKVQLITYIILLVIGTVFVSAFGIASLTLKTNSENLSSPTNDYDYSFKYTSSESDANGTAAIYPWFSFDNEYITHQTQDENGVVVNESFPVLSVASSESEQDGVLKPFKFVNSWNNTSDDYNEPQGDYESTLYHITDGQSAKLGINFQFGDVESQTWKGTFHNDKYDETSFAPDADQYINNYSDERKYLTVMSGDFGSFYRFNLENAKFQESVIGRLYAKYKLATVNFSDATPDAINAAVDIFNYMFFLNNSTLTDMIKNELLLKVNELIDEKGYDVKSASLADDMNEWLGMKSDNNMTSDIVDPLKTGLHGQIGWIQNVNGDSKYTIYSETNSLEIDDDFLQSYGGYRVNAFEKDNMFLVNSAEGSIYNFKHKILNRGQFFKTYYQMVGDLTDFKMTFESQVVMWGIGGEKYRYISSFSNIANDEGIVDGVVFDNSDNLKIYDKRDDSKSSNGFNFLDHSFIASQGYASKHNLKFGEEYSIIPTNDSEKMRFDAIGADTLNSFPTIYDEDLLTDSSTQGVFYLNTLDYSRFFERTREGGKYTPAIVDSSEFQDTSRAFLSTSLSDQNEIAENSQLFQLLSADNVANIATISDEISNLDNLSLGDVANYSTTTLQPRSETTILNLRSTLLKSTANIFTIVTVVFGIIFLLIILFVIYNIVKRMLIKQKSQIGNLKSLGVKNSIICMSFLVYMILPILIVVPIAWGVSLFCQDVIMKIFQNYFNIPAGISLGWQFMLIELVIALIVFGLVVFLVVYRMVKKNALNLLSGDSVEKPNLFLAKLNGKMKYKKFTSKLRGTVLVTSLKEVINFVLIFFVSSLIMATSIYVPTAVNGMKNEYYKNIDYQNGYQYSNILANMPLTNYGLNAYDNQTKTSSSLNNSFLNTYIGNEQSGFASLLDQDTLGEIKPEVAGNYFEWILFNNLTAMKGIQFTVNDLKQIIENAQLISSDFASLIEAEINSLSCTFIPTLFNQTPIEIDPSVANQYNQCISKVANTIIPSSVKERWNLHPEEFEEFSIDFGNINYDQNEDQLYSAATLYGEGLELNAYGMDLNQTNSELQLNNIDNHLGYNEEAIENKIIPVTVNKKAEMEGIKKGDVFTPKFENNLLKFGETEIDPAWWKYDDNGVEESIYADNVDLSHLTYFDTEGLSDDYDGYDFYWKDDKGEMQQYKKMQNIELIVPIDEVNKISSESASDLWDQTIDAYKKLKDSENPDEVDESNIISEKDGNYIIHPFDNRDFIDGVPQAPSALSLGGSSTKSNWWNIALNNGLIKLDETEIESDYQLKVVGYQDTYNGNGIYMNQESLNAILGFENFDASKLIGNQKINIYSNAKFSTSTEIRDQMERNIFKFSNGDTSFAALSDGMGNAITKADYVSNAKEMVTELVISVRALAIIFIFISLITAFIMIYIITEIVLGKFNGFMSYMRIQGYTNYEINSIFVWMFLPNAFISVLAGSLLIYGLLYGAVPKILISVGIAVPMFIGWWWIIIILFAELLIFFIAYMFVARNSRKTGLAEIQS